MPSRTAAHDLPIRYRSLLVLHPRPWRTDHGTVVLDTLRAVHEARGRVGPTVLERVDFALDGLRIRAQAHRRRRPVHRFADPAALAPVHAFDQSNGLVEDGRPLDEWEQVHANAAAGRNTDEQRVAPLAWFRLDAQTRARRVRRR